MTTSKYSGPDRRSGGPDLCQEIEMLREHIDSRFDALESKVNPMHEYYVTAKVGAGVVKWLAGIGLPVGAVWAWFTHGPKA